MNGIPVSVLATSSPFAYMEADAVAEFAAAGRIEAHAPGDWLFHEKQSPDEVLVVLDGVVYICTYEAEGRRVVEGVLTPVESFGWLSLIDPSPRGSNAVVRGQTMVLMIPKRDVLAVLERYPLGWRAVARFLPERLRRTLAHQRALAGFPIDRRIAFVLCQTFRIGVPGAVRLSELALIQEDSANITATSRQSVNRQLNTWADSSVVALGYNSLRVLDPDALLRVAQASGPSVTSIVRIRIQGARPGHGSSLGCRRILRQQSETMVRTESRRVRPQRLGRFHGICRSDRGGFRRLCAQSDGCES
jgi:CRP/FNR family transcriptional regulator, cyclic AMP receptor protein